MLSCVQPADANIGRITHSKVTLRVHFTQIYFNESLDFNQIFIRCLQNMVMEIDLNVFNWISLRTFRNSRETLGKVVPFVYVYEYSEERL